MPTDSAYDEDSANVSRFGQALEDLIAAKIEDQLQHSPISSECLEAARVNLKRVLMESMGHHA